MQGRLVPSRTGELECSAGPLWREEFEIAGKLDLSHVELLAERVRDEANPIWSAEGRAEMRSVAADAAIHLESFCVNEPLGSPYDDVALARALAPRLARAARDLEPNIVVLPLLEASDLAIINWEGAARSVRLLAGELPEETRIALELGVSAPECIRFLASISLDRVGLCYDVGNARVLGFDPAAELRQLGPMVFHIHAKDKNAAKENVRFGTGEVDFSSVFCALMETGFDGLVTMEATRGDDPIATAGEHRAFLLSMESSAKVLGVGDGH